MDPPTRGRAGSKTKARATAGLKTYAYRFFFLLSGFQTAKVIGPGGDFQTKPFGAPGQGVFVDDALDDLAVLPAADAEPGQRHFAQPQIDQAAAQLADHIIVLLWNAHLQQLEFPLVEPQAAIELARAGVARLRVGQQ